MYETSKMEIGVQIIWDGSLAAGCGGSMNICEEVCRFEELGTLQRRLFYQKKGRTLMSIGSDFYTGLVGWDREGCGLPEQASMKFEIGLSGSNTSCDCGDRCHDGSENDRYLTDLTFVRACRRPIVPHALLI